MIIPINQLPKSSMPSKKAWLDCLHYNHDKQQNNLELSYSYKDKEKTPRFSKWKKYIKCDEDFLEKANNRSILPNEIVIDIEQPERFFEILEGVKKDFEFYSAYKTGSKGYHIHLFFDTKLSSDEKKAVISKFGADEQKGTDRCLIAIENVPHWKTGNPKTLIEEVKGINKADFVKVQNKQKKAKEESDKVKSYLKEERQKYESLGCGFHNNVYYFGTKVFKDGQSFNAVVTSDKKFYVCKKILLGNQLIEDNEIRNLFGLNYKNEFYDESLDNIFSAKAINQWLFENCDKITLKSVFDKFVELLKKYIYLGDDRKYQLLACYRIAGFFMPIWKARARLFIHADWGSAKSRLSQILHNTGFNSVALGDWTLAYLKTIIESTRGETHIDDFETLPEEQKNASIRLVKVGYMRGFKAGKMSDGNKRRPEVNDLFNTTTLNNTQGLDFISADRCISVRIPKVSKKEYDKEPNFEEAVWQELRDELYILGLKYPKAVKETYEKIKSEKIRGRLFSIIKPELTIAKLISEKVYSDIEAFWVEETEQRQDIDFESDWEFLVYKKIYELNTESFFELKEEVAEPLGKELYSNEDEWKKKKRGFSTTIGKIFAREPRFQKRVVTGKTQYKISRENLISLLEAKNFLKPIKEILGEIGSTSPTLSTSSINSTSSTNDKNNVDVVEHIERGDGKTYKESENVDTKELDEVLN